MITAETITVEMKALYEIDRISISVSRKKSDGNFGSYGADAFVSASVSPQADKGQVFEDLHAMAHAECRQRLEEQIDYDELMNRLRRGVNLARTLDRIEVVMQEIEEAPLWDDDKTATAWLAQLHERQQELIKEQAIREQQRQNDLRIISKLIETARQLIHAPQQEIDAFYEYPPEWGGLSDRGRNMFRMALQFPLTDIRTFTAEQILDDKLPFDYDDEPPL